MKLGKIQVVKIVLDNYFSSGLPLADAKRLNYYFHFRLPPINKKAEQADSVHTNVSSGPQHVTA